MSLPTRRRKPAHLVGRAGTHAQLPPTRPAPNPFAPPDDCEIVSAPGPWRRLIARELAKEQPDHSPLQAMAGL